MPRRTAREGAKGNILIVDDDRLVLATLSPGLAQAGHDVIDADNGDDAILLARSRTRSGAARHPLEGKSGFDVAAHLRGFLQLPFMSIRAASAGSAST